MFSSRSNLFIITLCSLFLQLCLNLWVFVCLFYFILTYIIFLKEIIYYYYYFAHIIMSVVFKFEGFVVCFLGFSG